ncbi:hypothetical protein [Geobacter sp. AOG1]|uniref:hypothetical protein n=1 Tax=Geobacter sp. AOG1 TaxID=1566346 RepID=UPI001CC5A81E|nr:hypothetical protein [Geobacter sp. AOG1]GFE58732.1 hypothetical protein AOG1_26120 [Geobacter sp. AOG1]
MSDDYKNKLYEVYSAEREKLDAASIEAAGRYDKAVLAISTGALALSVTFIEKIASNPQFWTLFLLVLGWVLLLAAIIFQLCALSSSHNSTRDQISILDQQYAKYFLAEDPAKLVEAGMKEPATTNQYVDLTNKYNSWSQITLYVGITCILAFSSINIFLKKEIDVAAKSSALKPTEKSENGIKGSYTLPVNQLPPPPPKKGK